MNVRRRRLARSVALVLAGGLVAVGCNSKGVAGDDTCDRNPCAACPNGCRSMQSCSEAGWNCSCVCLEDGGADPDAGEPDSGPPPDAGALDGGEDGGAPDGGPPDGGSSDGGFPDGGVCAAFRLAARPVDMFIMFDQSGSMGSDCNVGSTTNSKWCNAINGLSTYFKSSAATGHGAALQYFALSAPIQCSGAGYDVSAVPGAPTGYVSLPSASFDANLNAHAPSTNTPHEAAMRGIIGFTGRAANRRPGRETIGVLITDGDPCCGECNENINTLSGLLRTHFTNTAVRTYIVGMTGANTTNLEIYAAGGGAPLHADTIGGLTDLCGNGAGPCRHWNVGNGNPLVFSEMMRQIQLGATGCGLALPADGGIIDPTRLSLAYLPSGQPPAQPLTRVGAASACVSDGWYAGAASEVVLCPTICATVAGDPAGYVEATLSCP